MEKISLISRVRAGDRKAFDELCRKYYAMLVSYARLFLRDDWAEDVVQDTMLKVWTHRGRWQHGRAKEPQWLVQSLCGGAFDAAHYTNYLKNKYTELYGL